MVVVLVGASGTGKTSIARAMAEKDGWVHAITTTTREPRKWEQDGVDYYFVSREEFEAKLVAGEFYEVTEYNGNLYGSPALDAVGSGNSILILDLHGAQEYLNMLEEQVFVVGLTCDKEVRDTRIDSSRAKRSEPSKEELQKVCDCILDTSNVSVEVLAERVFYYLNAKLLSKKLGSR